MAYDLVARLFGGVWPVECLNKLKGLILAQNERWRRGLGMQVVRKGSFGSTRAAQGRVTRGYLPPGLG